ncbi:MAG: hypothetical protein V3U48_00100 [Rhodospirillales bacterium]
MEDLENGAEMDEKTPEDEESSGEKKEDKNKEKNRDRFIPTEQRSAVESSRRSEEDRRQSDEEFEDEEKRHEPERRSPPDRREITHAATCKTSGSLAAIEDWLDDFCEGEWNIVLEALDDDLTQKSIRVMFELAGDREKFIQAYGRDGE